MVVRFVIEVEIDSTDQNYDNLEEFEDMLSYMEDIVSSNSYDVHDQRIEIVED